MNFSSGSLKNGEVSRKLTSRFRRSGCQTDTSSTRRLLKGVMRVANMDYRVEMSEPLTHHNARIRYDGLVEVDFNKLVDVTCPMSILAFPFDEQLCSLQFGSWSYQTHQINFTSKETFVPKNAVRIVFSYKHIFLSRIRNGILLLLMRKKLYPSMRIQKVVFTSTRRFSSVWFVISNFYSSRKKF